MKMLQWLGDALIPARCHLCGQSVDGADRGICPRCVATLPRTRYHLYPMNPMEQRFAAFFPFERATGFFTYAPGSGLARLIQDFKYRGYPSLAVRLGEVMGSELSVAGFLSGIDAIVPVPVHWLKQARRGYNQVERLAEGVSRASGVPVSRALRASRPHRSQTALDPVARAANTIGIFRLSRPESLAGKHLLLLDDVCTTGATLRSVALTILSYFPACGETPRLSILTLCTTQI